MLPRNEPQIRMVLYYCKDSSSDELGNELLTALQSHLPQFQFPFTTAESRALRGRDLSDFIKNSWGFRPENDGILILWDLRRVVQFSIRFPPLEGVRMIRDSKSRPYFAPAQVEVSIVQSEVTEEIMTSLSQLHDHMFVRLGASYSFICSSSQRVLPGPVCRRLRGIYWNTTFSPGLVDLIGPSKFNDLSCYAVNKLSDESLSVRLTSTFEKSLSKASRRESLRTMFRLGIKYFLPPVFNKQFTLPFRYLNQNRN